MNLNIEYNTFDFMSSEISLGFAAYPRSPSYWKAFSQEDSERIEASSRNRFCKTLLTEDLSFVTE